MHLISRLRSLVRDESGQDLIEYALLATLIACAVVLALQTAGATIVTAFWSTIATALQNVNA
jgi:Flp pilus assembly pilin Flp